MEKFTLTSFKKRGNHEKRLLKSGEIIFINKQKNNSENEKLIKNKSFSNQIKTNILINKQNQIFDDKKKNIKYYLSDQQKSDYINVNNFREQICLAKSQRIFNFFIKKNNSDNKSFNQIYRYPITTNDYNIKNNNINSNHNKIENNKISVNKSNEYINTMRKSSKRDLIRYQKMLYNSKYQNIFKAPNIPIKEDKKILTNQNFALIKIKKEPQIIKRPNSMKYNHIKIQKNIKKVKEIYDLNGVNINKRIEEQINNKYILGKTLGKGAYADVKLVTDKITKIDYAMKIYKKKEIKDKVRKRCVNNEIEILKNIDHKNIIKLIEVIDLKDYILIIQELFIGISLGQYHKKYWRTEELTKKKEKVYKLILTKIFSAMNYLHKKGIAHLDIKMENILINDKLDIKIIDFGFAVNDPKHTLNTFFGGTPNYMSPEIVLKRPYISILSDIWSLGVLVFKLFCNEYPFKGLTEKDLYNSIKKGKFRIKCFVNYDVKKIINSMLVLEPNKRLNCESLLKLPWFCVGNK